MIAILALATAGCLTSETEQYTISLNADGKSGTMTTIMRNIQSDDRDSLGQRGDFRELLRKWQEDSYLLENVKKQVYIKERALRLQRGVLVWREVALFADLRDLMSEYVHNDTLRMTFRSGEKVSAVNASVVENADTTILMWPMAARKLQVNIRHKDFHPTSDFVALFKAEVKK
jgi:hypothetical protein